MARKKTKKTAKAKPKAFELKAPIVVDAQTKAGAQPFIDFVASLRTRRNTEIAEAENDRLRPYFKSLSLYLKAHLQTRGEDLKTGDVGLGTGDKDQQPQPDAVDAEVGILARLSTPGALGTLFNAMAAYSRNTLTSEMVMLPDSIMSEEGPAHELFSEQAQFQTLYRHNGFQFHVGFFQVQAESEHKMESNSTTFPVFLYDKKIAKALKKHKPETMLEDLQAVCTFVNHDMLHHFTSPIINSTIASNHVSTGMTSPLNKWVNRLPRGDFWTEAYEDWAQVSHEQVLIEVESDKKAEWIADIERHVDRYFDELGRVSEEILGSSATQQMKADGKTPEQAAHELVDYMGMAMAHALSRVFSLDHQVMQRCLNRLEAVDPTPEETLNEMVRSKLKKDWDTGKLEDSPEDPTAFIREKFCGSGEGSGVLRHYRQDGLDLFAADKAEIPYKSLKMLQLTELSPEEVLRHAPRAAVGKMREKAGQAMVDMVKAAAEMIGFQPDAEKPKEDPKPQVAQGRPHPKSKPKIRNS